VRGFVRDPNLSRLTGIYGRTPPALQAASSLLGGVFGNVQISAV
jgi:hypothetical protein